MRWISVCMRVGASSDSLIPKEFGRSSSLVSDNETFLPSSLDFKDFYHRTVTRLDIPENILVDFEGIFGRLLEENGIGNSPDVGLSGKRLGRSGGQKGKGQGD